MITPVFYLDKLPSDSVFIIKNIFEKKNFKITKDIDKADIIIADKKTNKSEEKIILTILDDGILIENKVSSIKIDGEFENIIDTAIIHSLSLLNKCRPFDFLDFTEKSTKKISKFLQALVVTMEVEDKETKMSHSQRVAFYSEKFAQYMNWDKKEIEKIKEL